MRNPDSSLQKQEIVGRLDVNHQLTFSELYDQYAPVLLGVISRILADKTEALSALEVAFLRIQREMDQFQPQKQPLFVWLLQIARRTAVDALNQRSQSRPDSLQLTETGRVLNLSGQPATPVLSVVLADDSAGAQQKALLDSVLFKNCTPEEAALTVGISVEQARQQLRQAVQQLRKPTGV